MSDYAKELGERIRTARITAWEHRKMTQSELARLIRFSSGAVQYWERGRATPKLETLKKIAEVCGVDWQWLLVGDYVPNRTPTTKEG